MVQDVQFGVRILEFRNEHKILKIYLQSLEKYR